VIDLLVDNRFSSHLEADHLYVVWELDDHTSNGAFSGMPWINDKFDIKKDFSGFVGIISSN
jgi:hypothetical protein